MCLCAISGGGAEGRGVPAALVRFATRELLAKRAKRTLVPFLAWSLLVLVWKVATAHMPAPMGPRTLVNLVMKTQIIDVSMH